MSRLKVLICGTNDHATACALRLFRAGFSPVLLSLNAPLDLHHHRTFTRAVHLGVKSIDSIRARTWSNAIEQNELDLHGTLDEFIRYEQLNQEIPIVLEQDLKKGFKFPVDFAVLLDDDVAQTALSHLDENVTLIGLREQPAENIHYRIATDSKYLGRVIYPFNKDAFISNERAFKSKGTTLTAPKDGIFQTEKDVGQTVFKGDMIGTVSEAPLNSPIDGIIYGQLNSGIFVGKGQKVIEIKDKEQADTVRILPTESFAIAGGVLEAILFHLSNKVS